MHNLTNIDTVGQLSNSFRNISGHSKNSIFLFDQDSQIRFIIWREFGRIRFQIANT